MTDKPVGTGNGNAPKKSFSTAEVYRFRTKCRKCGKEFIVSYKQKDFTGQLKFNHCGTSSPYTINYENPWGIPSKHPNHPPDSSGTLYLIEPDGSTEETDVASSLLPTREDFEAACRMLGGGGETISLDHILNQMEANAQKYGNSLQKDWREVTEKNIAVWFNNP